MENVKLEIKQTFYNVGKIVSKYEVVRENSLYYYLCHFDGSVSDIQTVPKNITQSEFNKMWTTNMNDAYKLTAEMYKEKYLNLVQDESLVGNIERPQEEDTSIHPSDLEAIDTIDASVFSGDTYYDETNMKFLENKLIKWMKELNQIKKIKKES